MYTDDIVYYKPVLCEDDLVEMQSDVTTMADWVDTCGLHLNLKKTKCLVILRKHHPPSPPFTVSNTSIEQVPSFSPLGGGGGGGEAWLQVICHGPFTSH